MRQARELLNYRLKYCWLEVVCCITGGSKLGARKKSGGTMAYPGHPLESPLGTTPASVTFHLSDCFVPSLQRKRELV